MGLVSAATLNFVGPSRVRAISLLAFSVSCSAPAPLPLPQMAAHRSPCNLPQSASQRQISEQHPGSGRLARGAGDFLPRADKRPRVRPRRAGPQTNTRCRPARAHLSTHRNAELQVALVYTEQPEHRHSAESNIGGHCGLPPYPTRQQGRVRAALLHWGRGRQTRRRFLYTRWVSLHLLHYEGHHPRNNPDAPPSPTPN